MSFPVFLDQMKEIIRENPFKNVTGVLTTDLRRYKLSLLDLMTDCVERSDISAELQLTLLEIDKYLRHNFKLSPIGCAQKNPHLNNYLDNVKKIELLFEHIPNEFSGALKQVLNQIGYGFDHRGNDCLKVRFETALQTQLLTHPEWYQRSVYKVSLHIYDQISRLDFMNKPAHQLEPEDVAMLNRVLHYSSAGTRLNDQPELVEGHDFGRSDLPPQHMSIDEKRQHVRSFLLKSKTNPMAQLIFHHVFYDDLALKLYQPKKLSLFPALRTLMAISALALRNPGCTEVEQKRIAQYSGLALQLLPKKVVPRFKPTEHLFGTPLEPKVIRSDAILSRYYPKGDRGRKKINGILTLKATPGYANYGAFFSRMPVKPYRDIGRLQGVDPKSPRGIKALTYNQPFVAGPAGSATTLVACALDVGTLTPNELKEYNLAILAKTLAYHSYSEIVEQIQRTGYGGSSDNVAPEYLNDPFIFPDDSVIKRCVKELKRLYPLLGAFNSVKPVVPLKPKENDSLLLETRQAPVLRARL